MRKPKLRFQGYTDDWEQRKLGSLLNETREKTKVENEDTLLSCAIDGMYLNSELFSHFRGSSNIGYLKVKKNDLILSAQNLHLGNCNVNLRFEHGIISPAYKVYEFVDCDPLFMQAWVKQDSTKKFFLKASTEGASVCRKNIVWDELYKQTLPIPKLKEQEKIGQYFNNLDHLITLHQRKCEETKKLKKYMLQKMFPKKGMTVPEIRFDGFTDDWEQRKLGEIADKVSEKNKNNEFSEPFTNSAEQGIISQKEYFDREIVNNENLNGYYIVKNDDFIYNPRISVTAPVGPINRNRLGRNGVMSPLYTVFRTHDIDNLYLEFYFKTTKWHRFMKLNGDSGARFDRFTISSTQFMEMPIPYPTLDEQIKIGEYFDNLDHLITLHQRKCEELQKLKKFMLQNMFV